MKREDETVGYDVGGEWPKRLSILREHGIRNCAIYTALCVISVLKVRLWPLKPIP